MPPKERETSNVTNHPELMLPPPLSPLDAKPPVLPSDMVGHERSYAILFACKLHDHKAWLSETQWGAQQSPKPHLSNLNDRQTLSGSDAIKAGSTSDKSISINSCCKQALSHVLLLRARQST